jgi:hypothetical protein
VIPVLWRSDVTEESPRVRFQPCEAFSPDPDPAAGTCTACGWLEEDHLAADEERQLVATRA